MSGFIFVKVVHLATAALNAARAQLKNGKIIATVRFILKIMNC
jgi:hypothetical protein